jgi:hypothetical protein
MFLGKGDKVRFYRTRRNVAQIDGAGRRGKVVVDSRAPNARLQVRVVGL